jgi:outer membrane protein assembly factor BamB
MCISVEDGTTIWEYETEGAVLNSPLISNGRIIFGTDDNIFYVLEEVFNFSEILQPLFRLLPSYK